MTDTLSLDFGALADPIQKQLNSQGFALSEKDAQRYQKIADAITLLFIQGIIPEGTTHKLEHKLIRNIADAESLTEGNP
jgi:hypothetical protein